MAMRWLGWIAAVAAVAMAVAATCWAGPLLALMRRLRRLPQVLVPPAEKADDALRVGLLGASFIGRVAVVYAAAKRHDVIVVAVASRNKARSVAFAEQFGIPSSYGGDDAYSALLHRPDIDAVYISLPTQLHYHWASLALAAGKHVLLEKPIAVNAAEASALHTQAEHASLVLMEAAHHQYHPALLHARKLLLGTRTETSSIGQLMAIEARFTMIDVRAWFTTLFGSDMLLPVSKANVHARTKNFDRWWYCVNSLLWITGASSAHVVVATEGHFSMSAQLTLNVPAISDAVDGITIAASEQGTEKADYIVNATLDSARDRLLSPFDWSLTAHGTTGTLRVSNIGYPFLWHTIDIETLHAVSDVPTSSDVSHKRYQLYGEGETTFEHQLAAFVAAVRHRVANSTTSTANYFGGVGGGVSVLTMGLVDEILKTAGTGPISSK